MSSRQRHSMIGRRLWSVALTGTALAVMAAGPSAAQNPDETIDAKANPDAAAAALNSGCADMSNCTWKSSSSITAGYGDPSILGDVLYNCSPDTYAETAVGVEDERQESTSISEKVSLKISLGFLGFEKTSAEFSVFSKQSNSFSASVKVTHAVAVPPGYKGWTVTRVLSGNVTGSAYITQGINNLIQVKNIDLSFPGYQDPNKTPPDDPVAYTGIKTKMDPDDIKASCDTSTVSGATLLRRAQAPPSKFQLGLCRRSGRCTSRKVKGSLPPRVHRASALLTRAGLTYGRGTHTRGHTQLHMRRPLNAGRYKLTLRERPAEQIGTGPLQAIKTIVPITVG
jgi:hypothetical protein